MSNHGIPESALAQHIAIVGKTGSGKSYTAKGVVEQLVESGKRVCVIDPGGDWWGLRAPGTGPGLPVAVLGGRHADIEIEPDSGREVGRFIADENLPCVVDLSDWYKSDQIKFMFGFAETVYRENRHPLHLVIDEADQFSPQNPMAETKKLLNRMEIIVRLGRKRGFRVVMITQRPAILHKNVLTQCNTLIAMRMTSPQDKKAINEWIADNASRDEAKEVMRSLAKLERGEGWVWAPDQDLLALTTFSENMTYDAGRTPEYGEEVVEPTNLADMDIKALQDKFHVAKTPAEDVHTDPDIQRAFEQRFAEKQSELDQANYVCNALKSENDALRAALAASVSVASEALERGEVLVPTIEHAKATPPPRKTPLRQVNKSSKVDVLVQAAERIWPVRVSWAALCSMTGRKARGGHFNTTRKRLIEEGIVREDGALVTLLSPPQIPGGTIPADLLEQNLPNPANRMFAYIRANPGTTAEQLGEALGMQTRGGHWNTGFSILRNNQLITDSGGRLSISRELEST
jgi:hypothetical protein